MGDRDRRMGARSSAGARGLSGRGADGSGATGRRTHLALRGPFVWTGLAGGTVTESVSHDANTWDGGTWHTRAHTTLARACTLAPVAQSCTYVQVK